MATLENVLWPTNDHIQVTRFQEKLHKHEKEVNIFIGVPSIKLFSYRKLKVAPPPGEPLENRKSLVIKILMQNCPHLSRGSREPANYIQSLLTKKMPWLLVLAFSVAKKIITYGTKSRLGKGCKKRQLYCPYSLVCTILVMAWLVGIGGFGIMSVKS